MLCVANEGGHVGRSRRLIFVSAITLIHIVPVNKNYLVSLFDVVIFPAETAYTCR